MPIGAWVIVGIISFVIVSFSVCIYSEIYGTGGEVAIILVSVFTIAGILFFSLWYYNNTAAGKRAMIDQKSNFGNGLERTVTIYTANGDVIAEYSGLIDIEANDGGYIKFDFAGKRYMYYNCFVEDITEINE